MRFRIIFYDPETDTSAHFDVDAQNKDEAFSMAFGMPEAKSRIYKEVSVEEIKGGPKVIGIKFQYRDTYAKRDFCGYLFIRATNEEQARSYYRKHFQGENFWFDAGKTESEGKCVRGNILETYFAAGPGYDADATIM